MPYPSPLVGYENAPPLPTEISSDGKSLVNLESKTLSKAYDEFVDPIDKKNNGFDFHGEQGLDLSKIFCSDACSVYYMQSVSEQLQYARDLHERIRREFPEVRRSFRFHFGRTRS
jgi:hypothetical protein